MENYVHFVISGVIKNTLRSIPNENHSFRIIQCQTDDLLFNLITYSFNIFMSTVINTVEL